MLRLCYSICATILLVATGYSQRLSIDDICTLEDTGSQGICKLLTECDKALQDLQNTNKFPQTCGFQGTQPIVCCEMKKEQVSVSGRNPGEMSKRKCKEYARYIYERKRPPILLIDTPEVEKNECGHKVVKLIVGGDPAGRKEFPHMAVLGYEVTPGDIRWLCGGTIISNKYILTAGHCLSSKEFGPVKYVKIGVIDVKDTGSHSQQFNVTERIANPQYKSSSHYHDIGLIKLNKPAKLNPFARPACLYLKDEVEAEKAIATGWGNTEYGGVSSDDLLKVTLNLFDNNYCNKSYKNQISRKLKNGIMDDIQLCAGAEDEEKDTCQGDSGGPLQIYHIGDEVKCMYDIVGVTSFGKACTGSPGVYTRVSNYIKWIEDIIWP